MTFATSLLATSHRLLQTYGQEVTFERIVEGDFDPITGEIGEGDYSSYTAFIVPITIPGATDVTFDTKEMPGNVVQQDDLQIYLEVVETVPLIGDTVTISDKIYRVLKIANYVAQGTTLLYKLQLRI